LISWRAPAFARAYRHGQRPGTDQQGDVLLVKAHRREAALHPAGKPTQNAFVESFNGKFREYCLNLNWFASLDDARSTLRLASSLQLRAAASVTGQETSSGIRQGGSLINFTSHIQPCSHAGVRSYSRMLRYAHRAVNRAKSPPK
jgi:hypothetical protein